MQFNSEEVNHRKVSVVVVTSGNLLLIGKRKDSGKWAIPGGRMEDDEMPEDVAKREMKEESGIEPPYLQFLRTYKLHNDEDKLITVHVYRTNLTEPVVTDVSGDPDKEFQKWKWVDISKGLPDKYRSNLHRDFELGLIAMGIL
jgi:ADP-ribose pyrophosphatase YjhB (NUDIX family)